MSRALGSKFPKVLYLLYKKHEKWSKKDMKTEKDIIEKLQQLEEKLDLINGENNLTEYLKIFKQIQLLKWVLSDN